MSGGGLVAREDNLHPSSRGRQAMSEGAVAGHDWQRSTRGDGAPVQLSMFGDTDDDVMMSPVAEVAED